MNHMGLQAAQPRINTSRKHPEHKVYPYLLSVVKIARPDQVWSSDITYIRVARGFLYRSAEITAKPGGNSGLAQPLRAGPSLRSFAPSDHPVAK